MTAVRAWAERIVPANSAERAAAFVTLLVAQPLYGALLPFGRARLFRSVRDMTLPDWAQPFANSWGQFFLKYLLSDPRVTAAIPGTDNPAHMADNLGAMRGPLPDPDQRRRMVAFADSL